MKSFNDIFNYSPKIIFSKQVRTHVLSPVSSEAMCTLKVKVKLARSQNIRVSVLVNTWGWGLAAVTLLQT